MKKEIVLAGVGSMMFILPLSAQVRQDYPLTPVDFTHVTVTDQFWRPRIETNASVTIPYAFHKCEEEGRVDNFIFAGGIKKGRHRGDQGFDDSDVYKVLEGAAYTYQVNKDEALKNYMDTLIRYIGAAQESSGYLYTAWTLRARDYNTRIYATYDTKPYDNMDDSHELYNMGHMYEAAVAHYQATGQRNFLDIAIKNANHLYETFGPGKREGMPGHQEIEIGLVKLYRVTGDNRYLTLAKLFIDRRGQGIGSRGTYNQDHKPIIEQDEAVGHAVRANYMYSAITDIAAITGDKDYLNAIDKIWENVVGKKMYLTGGLGASYGGEAYGRNYELPNVSYAETCAAIASVYWNHRMFLLHGKAKYIDVLERTLYNGLISGISMDGKEFFYPNVLYSDGKYKFNRGASCRSPWFGCSCCPTNDARFMSSISGYIYAVKDENLYVNLYMSNNASITLGEKKISVEQETNYPWGGKVVTRISPSRNEVFSLYMRIPGWAVNKPVASDLYRYLNPSPSVLPVLKINGKETAYEEKDGYAVLTRKWKKGDAVELVFPMEVKKVLANEAVEADRGRMALEYGPVVYCFEEVDNGNIDQIMLLGNQTFKSNYEPSLLNGIMTLTAENTTSLNVSDNKVQMQQKTVKAIPYYAWNHRGIGSMAVWMPIQMKQVKIVAE